MSWTVQVFSPSLALEDEFEVEVERDTVVVALDAAIKRLWKGTASFALPALIRLWPTATGEWVANCYAVTYPEGVPDEPAEPAEVRAAKLGDVLGEWRAGLPPATAPGEAQA